MIGSVGEPGLKALGKTRKRYRQDICQRLKSPSLEPPIPPTLHQAARWTTPEPGMCVVNGKVARFSLLGVGWVCGWEDRALQECNLSAQSSVDCESIPSRPWPNAGAGSFYFKGCFLQPWLKRKTHRSPYSAARE